MSSGLIITGMHRSGTSMTASWLEKCGLKLSNSLKGDVGNERGHFEDIEFLKLNINSVKRQVVDSKGWIIGKNDSLGLNEFEKKQAKEIVQRRKEGGTNWGWKDPRTTLFLTDYNQLSNEFVYLLIWRKCSEVVDSLLRRSEKATNNVYKITFNQSLANWIAYNERIVRFVESNPESTLLYKLEDVINNDKKLIEMLNNKFELGLSYVPIDQVYDKTSLNSGQSKGLSFVQSLKIKLSKARSVENRLLELSSVLT